MENLKQLTTVQNELKNVNDYLNKEITECDDDIAREYLRTIRNENKKTILKIEDIKLNGVFII